MPCIDNNASEDMNATDKLVGSWVQPIPGLKNEVQGFSLKADGSASSINMASLLYSSWKVEGNKLMLMGKSLGNGVTTEDKEVYEYSFCDTNHLCLQHPNADEVVKYKYQAIDK